MKVGFIGLGKMGLPMATNILKRGCELYLYNRTRSKTEALAVQGAKIADSPFDLAHKVDIVLACLADLPASEEVFLGDNGLVSAARPGQILVDHSTVSPEMSRRFYSVAKRKGVHFLDAPVSGGVERATNGTLTLMVGGEEEAFQRARPVFEGIGKNIRYVGPSGSGSVIKLVNQLLVSIHTVAAAEALLLGAKACSDPALLLEILNTSWGTSFMLSRNGPLMLNRTFEEALAPLRLFFKDLALVDHLAEEVQVPLSLGKQVLKILQQAADQGMSELDISAVTLILEQGAGLKQSKSTSCSEC